MLERFTIDMVAQYVADQLMEGEPTPKLAHKFFRKGRRDGKKGYAHASVATLIKDAVSIAGSALGEELESERFELLNQIARFERLAAELEHLESAPSEPVAEEPTEGPDVETSTPSADGQDSAALLQSALEARRRLAVEASRRRAWQEAEAARQARANERESRRQAALQAAQALPVAHASLDQLELGFQQRFRSVVHTGRLLWSRYCNGYAQGSARAETPAVPDLDLSFEVPWTSATTSIDVKG